MIGVELLLGALAAWAVRKGRRVGDRMDQHVDQALDDGVERLGALLTRKMGSDPALMKLEAEAVEGEITQRTGERVRLAVEDAADTDPDFAARLAQVLRELEVAAATGPGGTTVLGGVTIRADNGSVAAWSITGPVTTGGAPPADGSQPTISAVVPPDPSDPGRR